MSRIAVAPGQSERAPSAYALISVTTAAPNTSRAWWRPYPVATSASKGRSSTSEAATACGSNPESSTAECATAPSSSHTASTVRDPMSSPRTRMLVDKHLDERLDARAQLAEVFGRVVGVDLEHRDASLARGLLNPERLDLIRAAELQRIVHDPVRLCLLRHTDDVVETAFIRREARTVDAEVLARDVVEHLLDRVGALVREGVVVARAGAHLLGHYHGAGLLDDVVQLPVRDRHRRAGYQYTRGVGGCDAGTRRNARLRLVRDLVHHLG